jgi:hypothetical protein
VLQDLLAKNHATGIGFGSLDHIGIYKNAIFGSDAVNFCTTVMDDTVKSIV